MAEASKLTYPGDFIEICNEDEVFEDDAKLINIKGYEVLLVNVNGEIRAYYARCAHALGLLEPSSFDGEKIVCPVHLWEYDAKTGESINPEGSCLFSFDIIKKDGKIYVKVPSIPTLEFKVKYYRLYNSGE
jgi:toluene monooxygenase system ferredoxin subunit